MKVPKPRPPSPHSCNRSRSPLRQWAAAKPSQVMNANSSTKTISATQFTSLTRVPSSPSSARPEPDHRCHCSGAASSRSAMALVKSPSGFSLLFAHDLFGKPLNAFPDHALTAAGFSLGREVNDRSQDRADDDPEKLIPVKERHARQCRLRLVVEGRPQHRDELDDEQQIPPAPSVMRTWTFVHGCSQPRKAELSSPSGTPGPGFC